MIARTPPSPKTSDPGRLQNDPPGGAGTSPNTMSRPASPPPPFPAEHEGSDENPAATPRDRRQASSTRDRIRRASLYHVALRAHRKPMPWLRVVGSLL